MTSTIRSVIAPLAMNSLSSFPTCQSHFCESVDAYFTFRSPLRFTGSLESASELVQEHHRWSSSSEAKPSKKTLAERPPKRAHRMRDEKGKKIRL